MVVKFFQLFLIESLKIFLKKAEIGSYRFSESSS